MKSFTDRYTTALRKIAGFSLALFMGLVGFLSDAEARLIFTTEDEGVNADAYHLDNDDTSSDYIDLAFGTGLGSRLRYDILNSQFLLNKDLNLEGNELKNFVVENSNSALTCAAAEKGRMYYDTDNDDLYFCNGTTWVSTSTNVSTISSEIDGAGLVDNSGVLDVNVDGTTIEVASDSIKVKDGGISTAKLADGAVNSAKILDGSVATADLADDAVTTDKIADNAVGSDQIANGSVKTEDIDLSNFTIGSDQVTDGSLTTDDLGTNSVGSDEIATGAVTTTEILDGTVATVDLADGSVNSAKILNGSVGTSDIAAGTNNTFLTTDGSGNVVWELKSNFMSSALADGQMWIGDSSGKASAVTMSGDATLSNTGVLTIANNAINSAKISDGSISTADLADDSITAAKLAADTAGTGLQQNATTGALEVNIAGIADGTTINDNGSGKLEIVDGSVNSAKILNNSIETDDLKATGAGNNKILTTDGTGKMVWVDDAAVEREVSANIAPEFQSFTLQADGSNNKGTMESDHDSASNKNYYKWTTRKTGSLHDYDIVFQWMVPDDFQSWSTTNNSIEVDYKTDTTSASDNKLDITMKDTAGSAVTLAGAASNMVSSAANTWVEDTVVAGPSLSGTFTPGEYVTITIKMSSKATSKTDKNPAYLGAFNFNYVAK